MSASLKGVKIKYCPYTENGALEELPFTERFKERVFNDKFN